MAASDDGVVAGVVVATDDGVAAAGAAAVPVADDSEGEADDQT
jgi:hypothetical protein